MLFFPVMHATSENASMRPRPIWRGNIAPEDRHGVHEGHLMPDHVHMLIQIPPKYSIAGVVGYMKEKSAIWIARNWHEKVRYFGGEHFWAHGFYEVMVGRDEKGIRDYLANQEKQDQMEERQLSLSFK